MRNRGCKETKENVSRKDVGCVTMQTLNRYLDLIDQLDSARKSLLDLQDAAVPGAQKLTGMPHAPGVRDKVGDFAIEIADTKAAIADMEREIEDIRKRIVKFIDEIPYVDLRTIFRMRYIRLYDWEDIAEVFNFRYSESTYRKRVSGYMEKYSDDHHVQQVR